MPVQMIKHNGRFVPAKKNENGKWVPDEDSMLMVDTDGEMKVKRNVSKKEYAPA